MPPDPVSGFCIFPRVAHDVEDGGPDRLAVAAVGPVELADGGRVQVQPLDPHPDLVGPQVVPGVEPLGGLGQDVPRSEDAVQPYGAAVRRCHKHSFSSLAHCAGYLAA